MTNCELKYEDMTRFNIEMYEGKKYIHFDGYYYFAEGEEKPYRNLEYTWFMAPLGEVLEYGVRNYEADNASEIKQYCSDYSESEIVELERQLYESGIELIEEKDIKIDMQCGYYIY